MELPVLDEQVTEASGQKDNPQSDMDTSSAEHVQQQASDDGQKASEPIQNGVGGNDAASMEGEVDLGSNEPIKLNDIDGQIDEYNDNLNIPLPEEYFEGDTTQNAESYNYPEDIEEGHQFADGEAGKHPDSKDDQQSQTTDEQSGDNSNSTKESSNTQSTHSSSSNPEQNPITSSAPALVEISSEEKEVLLKELKEDFEASHALHVWGWEGLDNAETELRAAFKPFGEIRCLLVPPVTSTESSTKSASEGTSDRSELPSEATRTSSVESSGDSTTSDEKTSATPSAGTDEAPSSSQEPLKEPTEPPKEPTSPSPSSSEPIKHADKPSGSEHSPTNQPVSEDKHKAATGGSRKGLPILVRMRRPDAMAAKEALNKTCIKDHEITVEDAPHDSFLFVGNLTDEVTTKELRALGEVHGIIERAFVSSTRMTCLEYIQLNYSSFCRLCVVR